jgi:hypothetical protein
VTDRELDDVENEFAALLVHLSKNPKIRDMSAAEGFTFLAGILRSHSARSVEVQGTWTIH